MTGSTDLLDDDAVGSGDGAPYLLAEQIGFLLRRASQRHLAIFARHIPDLTPPQWAALAALHGRGKLSQAELGQAVAMDAATVKGVVERLAARGFVRLGGHEADRRKVIIALTGEGRSRVERGLPEARRITAETLAPLSERETATLQKLLAKLG